MESSFPPAELIGRVTDAMVAARVPYMLTGSVVSGIHGRARSTHDLDVVIDPPDGIASLPALLAGFPDADFYVSPDAAEDAIRRRGMFNAIHHATGWKVDVIVRRNRPFSRAEFERRQRVEWFGQPRVVATAEDTVIAKLEWHQQSSSARQLEDAAAILAIQGDRLDRAHIEHWVADLGLKEPWAAVRAMA